MLIEFTVKNFRSIKETQTLSMVSNAKIKEQNQSLIPSGIKGLPDLVRTAAVYGANASGKSNLIRAFSFASDFVKKSAGGQIGDTTFAKPFLFDMEKFKEPSEFEFFFIKDGIRYQYGFALNSERVVEEWLFAFPKGSSQKWFTRTYNPDSENEYDWYLNPSHFKKADDDLCDRTRNNALFLSVANQFECKKLKPVFDWLHGNVYIKGGRALSEVVTFFCEEEIYRTLIVAFLNKAGIKVDDIEYTKGKNSNDFPKIKFLYSIENFDEKVAVKLEEESDGTQVVFSYAIIFLAVLQAGATMFADELETSLHPLLVRHLIKMFNDPEINDQNAQLVFSTHNTSLLNSDLFRRDQIWFVEKDKSKASQLYSMLDLGVRKGEAMEKRYLDGFYGGVPYLGDSEI